jgi:hypothetical protein
VPLVLLLLIVLFVSVKGLSWTKMPPPAVGRGDVQRDRAVVHFNFVHIGIAAVLNEKMPPPVDTVLLPVTVLSDTCTLPLKLAMPPPPPAPEMFFSK